MPDSLAAEPCIWLVGIGAHHLVDPLKVPTPTFLLPILTLSVPALFHDILESTHDGSVKWMSIQETR